MKIDNLLKPLVNIYSKLTNFGKILLFSSILLIVIVFFRKTLDYQNFLQEGFKQKDKFTFKDGNNVYDEFYSTIYDHLVHSDFKDNYEVMSIFKKTTPTNKSIILDVGSGTGHHVGKLSEKVNDVRGIDISPSMIKESQKNYPGKQFILGDVLDRHQFDFNSFTHILCLYFTIYFLKDKRAFFDNCMDWLMPGGYLVIHLVDPLKFDPILPPGNPLYVVSPQKYAKERITKTKINFNEFIYDSNFTYDELNEIANFQEKFKFHDGNTRKQEQKLYMESLDKIIAIAQESGFILHSKIDMVKCAYEYQYLYIFMKPG